MRDLPHGWRAVSLRDLGSWYGGGTPSKARTDFWEDGTVPWLSPKDMGSAVLSGTQDRITEAAVTGSNVRLVPAGAVALVVRSGILERTVPVSLVPFETTLNQDMKAIAPSAMVDARWIAWGLRAMETQLLRSCRKAGTTVASLEVPRLMDRVLPVPPLDEQRRIVEILEDHISRLDAADQGLAVANQRLTSLESAVLSETRGADADLIPLASVTDIQGGIQKQPRRTPRQNAFPFLRVANVTSTGLDLAEVHSIELFDGELERLRLEVGDLLVVEGNGSASQIGRAALWDGSIPNCVHQNHLIRVRPLAPLLPGYLEAVWNAPQSRHRLTEIASSTSGLYTLSVSKLKSLSIPIRPMPEQTAVVERVAEVREQRRRLADAIHAARMRRLVLRRSLLQAAFSGRLTGAWARENRMEELASV